MDSMVCWLCVELLSDNPHSRECFIRLGIRYSLDPLDSAMGIQLVVVVVVYFCRTHLGSSLVVASRVSIPNQFRPNHYTWAYPFVPSIELRLGSHLVDNLP